MSCLIMAVILSSDPTKSKQTETELQNFFNSIMTTENDLILAIKDSLENDGTLGKFKAKMRSKIMEILSSQENSRKPNPPNETILVNELIREYLSWHGYKYAKSIFIQESGLNREPLPRSQLLADLGVLDSEESSKFAILHGIIAAFKEDVKREL